MEPGQGSTIISGGYYWTAEAAFALAKVEHRMCEINPVVGIHFINHNFQQNLLKIILPGRLIMWSAFIVLFLISLLGVSVFQPHRARAQEPVEENKRIQDRFVAKRKAVRKENWLRASNEVFNAKLTEVLDDVLQEVKHEWTEDEFEEYGEDIRKDLHTVRIALSAKPERMLPHFDKLNEILKIAFARNNLVIWNILAKSIEVLPKQLSEPFIEHLKQGLKNPQTTAVATDTLIQFQHPDALVGVEAIIANPDIYNTYDGSRALRHLRDYPPHLGTSIQLIYFVLEDPNSSVAQEIVSALSAWLKKVDEQTQAGEISREEQILRSTLIQGLKDIALNPGDYACSGTAYDGILQHLISTNEDYYAWLKEGIERIDASFPNRSHAMISILSIASTIIQDNEALADQFVDRLSKFVFKGNLPEGDALYHAVLVLTRMGAHAAHLRSQIRDLNISENYDEYAYDISYSLDQMERDLGLKPKKVKKVRKKRARRDKIIRNK